MIRSFAGKVTQALWQTGACRRKLPPSLWRVALRKLLMLDSARSVEDLRVPPGNRLEKLQRDRKGQHSIRINEQYRICFVWREGDAHEVEVTDYH